MNKIENNTENDIDSLAFALAIYIDIGKKKFSYLNNSEIKPILIHFLSEVFDMSGKEKEVGK